MTASSLPYCLSSFILANTNCYSFQQPAVSIYPQNATRCSFLSIGDTKLASARIRRTKKDFIVRNATPEAAADILSSSLTIPGIEGFADNPWLAGAAGLLVLVPFVIQRLITLTKEIDVAAETVEKIADTVGKVAEEVDKAAEDMVEKLPEGGLKKVASMVEHLAEETVKDAQKVEDLMDKIEELDDKVEEFINKQSKGAERA